MSRQQTIYLVDDEPAVRRSLERLLKSAGAETHEAWINELLFLRRN